MKDLRTRVSACYRLDALIRGGEQSLDALVFQLGRVLDAREHQSGAGGVQAGYKVNSGPVKAEVWLSIHVGSISATIHWANYCAERLAQNLKKGSASQAKVSSPSCPHALGPSSTLTATCTAHTY